MTLQHSNGFLVNSKGTIDPSTLMTRDGFPMAWWGVEVEARKHSFSQYGFVDVKHLPLDLDEISETDRHAAWSEAHLKTKASMTSAKVDQAPEAPTEQTRRFSSFSELKSMGLQVTWIIYGWLSGDTTGLVFGPRGCGKSFIVLDWLLCIATGLPWNGHKVTPGVVVYFVGEGFPGFVRRLEAWRIHHDLTDADIDKNFVLSNVRIPFDGDMTEIILEIGRIESERGQPVLGFAIDTLARHIPAGAEENSVKDMSAFVDKVDFVRTKFPGSFAAIVTHSGHNETGRARGSSALEGAMDFVFGCSVSRTLTHTKMKDGAEQPDVDYRLQVVDLGIADGEGQPITSCVPVFGEKSTKSGSLTAYENTAITALLKVSAGRVGTVTPQHQRGALVGDWRSGFYDIRNASEPDLNKKTLQSQFDRAAEKLIKKGIVREDGHNRILTGEEHQQEIITIQFSCGLEG